MKQANQHLVDPRQSLFLENYFDPKSGTFANALQSALKAKYSQEYAEILSARMPKWLSEKVSNSYLLQKAESNIKEFLEDDENKKIKADMTKFVAERMGRKKWGQNKELESDNTNIFIKEISVKINKILP